MIPQNVEVAIRRMRTLADSALGSLYEVECQREMRNACILLEAAYKEPVPSIAKIEAEARRYAEMYPQSSDGRNTFIIFADWVAALAAQQPAAPVETVAAEPDYEIVKAGDDAYRACAGGAHYAGMDGITSAYRAMAKVLVDRATKSAPSLRTSQHAELLPKREPAGGGADTNSSAENEHSAAVSRVIWRHKKRGTTYHVVTHFAALQCASDPETEDRFKDLNWTIYRSREDGAVYIRLTSEFMDGRFERIGTDGGLPAVPQRSAETSGQEG